MDKKNESYETLISRIGDAKSLRKPTILLVIIGMVVCIIPLFSPVQNAFFSFIGGTFEGTNDPRYMRGVEELRARLSPLLSLAFVGFIVFLYSFCCLFSKNIADFLKNARNNRVIVALLTFLTSALLIFISIFAYRYGWQWLNSDNSSEMILGQLLAKENTFVSRNWGYSTEIRLVYQTLFTMPLFKLLGGLENWALIRAINIFLNNIVLLLSYFFLAKQLKVQVKWILLSCLFLIAPLSSMQWEFVTFGGYYIFFIAQLFCFVGLFIKLTDNTDSSKKLLVLLAFFSLLCFLLGLQGVRSLLVAHIPLFIASIWFYLRVSKKKFFLLLSVYGFIIGCIGFIGNFLLHSWYSFHSFDGMKFENLHYLFFFKLGQCLVSIVEFLGFFQGSSFLSAIGIFSLLSIIAAIIFFRVLFKLPQKSFLPLFFIVSTLLNIFVFIVAEEIVTSRYFIPFMILLVPLSAVLFEHLEKKRTHLQYIAIVFGISLFIFGQGYLNFQNWSMYNLNSNRKGYIQYLLDNQLNFGFAVFGNGNVNTELTNGRIRTAELNPNSLNGNGTRPLQVQTFLNPLAYHQSSFYENKEGEAFLLLSRNEWKFALSTNRAFALTEPDFQDDHFAVWRFPSAYTIFRDVLDTR